MESRILSLLKYACHTVVTTAVNADGSVEDLLQVQITRSDLNTIIQVLASSPAEKGMN